MHMLSCAENILISEELLMSNDVYFHGCWYLNLLLVNVQIQNKFLCELVLLGC